MTSNVIVQQINGGPIGVKNAIINGNFAINQRGVSGTVTLAAGAYGHDRWKAGASGCTYTFATSENVTTLTITAGSLIQVVEDINLLTDTYKLSWTGTSQGKIGAGSYGASGITGSVTGGSNLNVEFNTGTVSKVQLERGSVATPFEFRSIGQELGLCQRYFCKTYNQEFAPGSTSGGNGAISGVVQTTNRYTSFGNWSFPVPMRTTPSVSLFSPRTGAANGFNADSANLSPAAISSAGERGVSIFVNNVSVGTHTLISVAATASAEL